MEVLTRFGDVTILSQVSHHPNALTNHTLYRTQHMRFSYQASGRRLRFVMERESYHAASFLTGFGHFNGQGEQPLIAKPDTRATKLSSE